MTEANRAYEAGDTDALRRILDEFHDGADAIVGEGVGAELIRIIRQISEAKERITTIEQELATLRQSELAQLVQDDEKAKQEGRDLLAELAAVIRKRIQRAEQELTLEGPTDFGEASRWFRKAAAQGHAAAQLYLGAAYERGEGVDRNLAEAAHWYRMAGEQGNQEAQLGAGAAYELGLGDEQDWEAVGWCRKAAEQGYPAAQASWLTHCSSSARLSTKVAFHAVILTWIYETCVRPMARPITTRHKAPIRFRYFRIRCHPSANRL
jgi:Sel1 repeat-containing protein